jgi:ABC-type antimicrobial peptide transport system permease subunit
MACVILILLWVQDELSYNQFHENVDEIFRVNKEYKIGTETGFNPSTPYPLARAVKEKFAEIKDAVKFYRNTSLVKYGENKFNERRVCFTDSSFFNIFTCQFIKGNPETALVNPNSIVITQSMARKYFGDIDPVGKVLTLNNRDEFIISAVIDDMPLNSDLQFDFFVPISSATRPDDLDNWGSHYLRTYVLLHKNTNVDGLEQQLSTLIRERLPEEHISLKLQALNRLHLYTISGEKEGMKYVYFFSIIALFILIIACINFINLSTARSTKRAKEIGLRKVIGAERVQIIRQFYGESIIFIVIAFIVALGLVEFILPAFNNLTGKQLSINYNNHYLIAGFLFIGIFTSLLSGSYPALFLSSFQPVKVLKGTLSRVSKGASFRRVLVIIQFSLSIILMIGTGVIYSQLKYIKDKDVGYDKENLLYIRMNRDIRENFDHFKNELLQHSDIVGMARVSELPTEIWSIMRGITWEGKESEEGAAFGFAAIDHDFIETLNMEMVQGRDFSIQFPTDTANYIFNEKAISVMGMENPVGKRFSFDEDDKGTIIGVIKDFNFLPLTYEMEPLVLRILPDFYRQVIIKIRSNNIAKTIRYVNEVWEKNAPEYPFEYHFLDEQFDRMYGNELRMEKIFRYFVTLAVFISCLGLLGLASFVNEQRTKEIGIRKVLGASVFGVIFLLSKEFTKWVLLSNIIAWPVAWFIMNRWLQNFAYRIEIGIWIFVLSGMLALLIALLTVSYQAIKAAVANPVKALRYA